ncbi:MAG: pseudouridine synthase [Limnohabitans sp.]|nr:pseudouridine synthase [Limnohabitans sp.]
MPTHEGVSASVVAVPAGHWPNLLDFLAQRMPGIPRSEWAQRLDKGLVLQENGQAAQIDQTCMAGERFFYYRNVADEPQLPRQAAVVFEDDHLLVADKPHFMPVTPSGPYVQQCLLVQLKRLTGLADLVPLHRIDRETAGLVLFGKRLHERDAYHALFREHRIHKTYHAVAEHRPELTLPRVHTSHLAEDPVHFFKMREVEGEPNSETRIALLRIEGARALYKLEPVSGKRHQLRVHMMSMGLPIEGDQFYPKVLRGPHAPEDFGQPLQLLAHSVEFTDPLSGQARQFTTRQELLL